MSEFGFSLKETAQLICSLRLPSNKATFTFVVTLRLVSIGLFLGATVGLFG